MTPKEKAKELVDKFIERNYDLESFFVDERTENAKQCALICVERTLELLYKIKEINLLKNTVKKQEFPDDFSPIERAIADELELKQEIEKL